ncbi:uncharacterized protein si:dkey-197j19.6 isoform X2 [Triplophysa dalaica]|uniref:uncharacterized protein si:dkey-197j19.6 isoform X2 n=1 Tax=Triplophysa dalaica TaxID=1582913 RepID=UPI0024DFBA82|nr:uncharacterized protein si:dkey-197j19.6 isoform X2 [Triplophysa dalaica]
MSLILSPLLSTRENGLLFSLLSQDCNVLACSVVQLVIAAPPQDKEWKSHNFGVVCLVQDKTKHSTFLRLYCLKKAKLLWEQELYTPFEYSEACPYFHTFSGDECQAGLNFADEEEARQFYLAVQKQIIDNKAHSMLTRSYSVGSVAEWKEKLENCLSDSKVFKRQPSPVRGSGRSHNVDSPATHPESNPAVSCTMSSQIYGSPQAHFSTEVDSILSLAKRKGPLPPLPPHARAGMKLQQSGSVQTSDSPIHMLSWAPPPPAYTAPSVPLSSAVLKKSASFAPLTCRVNLVMEISKNHFPLHLSGTTTDEFGQETSQAT